MKPPTPSASQIFLGSGATPQYLNLPFANRHGLIAGATGTGKTVTLQSIAESFSRHGIPVFLADVKGDLAGIALPGGANPKVQDRLTQLGLPPLAPQGNPTILWDLYGQKGHPIRTTISEMGPLLLARLLDLNETQAGVLNICFAVADQEGLLLLDLKDLRSLLAFVSDHASEVSKHYGNVTGASVGAIQRGLLTLEQQGAEHFFGEPALDTRDLLRTTLDGRGQISLLAAETLIQAPKLYATFLLWLLTELYENLPEVGDLEKPRLAFFFDEAHLLFSDAPKALTEKIEQIVRLVRSKGVGIYFVTQHPQDIPEIVLGQLSNRVQHALRAFTPVDQKAVKIAAQTFRANPKFKTEEAITQLAVGEALVSVLDEKGSPTVVERTLICPPSSRIGPLTDTERSTLINSSPLSGIYDRAVDRESAFEKLNARVGAKAGSSTADAPDESTTDSEAASATLAAHAAPARRTSSRPSLSRDEPPVAAPSSALGGLLGTLFGGGSTSGGRQRMGIGETVVKQVARTVSSQIGRELVRGLMGQLMKR